MIELRWRLKRTNAVYSVDGGPSMFFVDRVLQYRYAVPDSGPVMDVMLTDPDAQFWKDHHWSEWKDVPEFDPDVNPDATTPGELTSE